jgi:hypothetical protein
MGPFWEENLNYLLQDLNLRGRNFHFMMSETHH